jgi:hypothetical protein
MMASELPTSAAPDASASPPPASSPDPSLGNAGAQPASGEAEAGETLADHEAAFSPGAAERAARAAVAPRDEDGRFLRGERHRAASQQARPDDVKVIGELTKRIKEAEAKSGADITQQPGESNRVYELRRRAELAERRANGNGAVSPAATSQPTSPPVASAASGDPAVAHPAAAERPAAVSSSAVNDPEPTEDQFEDFTKYIDARARWSARQEHRALRASEQRDQSIQTRVAAARKAYSDFDTVAFSERTPIPPTDERGHYTTPDGQDRVSVIQAWIDDDDNGFLVLYHLHKYPAEVRRLLMLSPFRQVNELALLGQRLSIPPPERPTAEAVGSAKVSTAQPVTRPPNPTRTGPLKAADKPPGDDSSSISDHEKYFAPRH